MVVSLKEIVDAMDLPNDEWVSYLNQKTGEIVTVTDEDRRLAEDQDLDEASLQDWERESLRAARAVEESGDYLALPDKFEIHEWALMERFSNGQAREDRRAELLDAIHGAGAFRMFRSTIRRLGIEDEWWAFRHRQFAGVLEKLLCRWPAVTVLGPRQCGKTTFVQHTLPAWTYVDLERPSDAAPFIADPEARLEQLGDRAAIPAAHLLSDKDAVADL